MLRHLRLPLALLMFSGFFIGSPVRAGMVTYQIMNYPGVQEGWVITGTITVKTNAASGTLMEKDIVSWMFTITNKKTMGSFTVKSTDKGASLDIEGKLSYSPTQLYLTPGTKDSPNLLALNGDDAFSQLLWRNAGDDSRYQARIAFSGYKWTDDSSKLGGKKNWIIATAVPEPPAAIMAGIGFLSVLACTTLRGPRRAFSARIGVERTLILGTPDSIVS